MAARARTTSSCTPSRPTSTPSSTHARRPTASPPTANGWCPSPPSPGAAFTYDFGDEWINTITVDEIRLADPYSWLLPNPDTCRASVDRTFTGLASITTTVHSMPAGRPYPLLFLDVDGPLIPIGSPPEAVDERTGNSRLDPRCVPPALRHLVAANPLLGRLNPQHGQWLAALPCDLVWATTWMTDANEVISPLLGLPDLPVVDWLDTDRHWGQAHHPGPALLHAIDPRRGLTRIDVATIRAWLAKA